MSSPGLERTATPGIYKRGSRYVVVFRDPSGRQRKRSARTLAEARVLKGSLTAAVASGEYRSQSRATFAEYATEWIGTYSGRTSRGIRAETLADYRRDLGIGKDGELLGDGAIGFFGRMRLAAIEPRHVKAYAAELAGRGLSPASVRNTLAPVRALLATAFEDGLIRSNPAAGVRIAQATPEDADEEQEKAKALSPDELRRLLEKLPDEWRPFFEFLAHSGCRIGEVIALQWKHVDVTGRCVRVRRRWYRAGFAPPKSKYGRRDIPLSPRMALELQVLRGAKGDDELVFTSSEGAMIDASNLVARVLKPAAADAGLGTWEIVPGRKKPVARSWVSPHVFRHTCASMLFREGLNAKQVQVWLGHHSPGFTLATYVHLLPGDMPAADFLDALTGPAVATPVATSPTETRRNEQPALAAVSAG